ncbi:MAG TPA: CHRD domain-containing protein, partial [Thermoanaerobaculia bacterium]|nr:CHRD domain-containing protein [Thermoanaerobaculia bacterium]
PVVITLPAATNFSLTAAVNPRLVADFAAGFLYVNIHSADFPEGEIRGQLVAEADILFPDVPTLDEWAAVVMLALLTIVALARLNR